MNRVKLKLPEVQPVIPIKRPKIFYGWWIVISCAILLIFSTGIGFYGLGVFLPYFEKEFNASPSQTSFGITIFFLVAALSSPFIGRQIDIFGPHRIIMIGIIIFGLGLAGLGLAQTLWQTYLAYMVLSIGFMAMGFITVTILISSWFNSRRSLAMGLTTSGLSIGGVIMIPLITQLIVTFGWRATIFILLILTFLVTLPISVFLVSTPQSRGLLPDNALPPATAHSKETSRSNPPASLSPVWILSSARQTKAFWMATISFFLVNTAQVGLLVHLIRYLTYGSAEQGAMTPQVAAFALSITTLTSGCGRLVLGPVLDRVNRRLITSLLLVLQVIAITGLILGRGNLIVIYLALLVLGLGLGLLVILPALLVGDLFGLDSFGGIYGGVMLPSGIGSAIGPWFAGFLFDLAGNYQVAFGIFGVMYLVAAFTIAWTRSPNPPGV